MVDHFSMNYGKVTFCYGQTLRLHFTYTVDPTQADEPMPAIRAAARLKNTSGNTIYVSTQNGGIWKTTNGGETCSFDVSRDELSLAGDQRTGALGVVPELMIEVPAGMRPDFPTSLEITDNLTGKLVFHEGRSAMHVQKSGGTFTLTFNGQTTSVARGETLQINLTNPLPLTLAGQTVAAIDYLINIKGIEGESEARTGRIKPGQTIVAKFNRDQLPDAGGVPTGSVRFIVDNTYSLQLTPDQFAALGELPHFPISFEIVDNATGNVTARFDSYYGTGVYKSVDSGQTW
jgi:hypothetical protein